MDNTQTIGDATVCQKCYKPFYGGGTTANYICECSLIPVKTIDQFKQELIDELDQFDNKLKHSAEFRAGINKAIEIIKSK